MQHKVTKFDLLRSTTSQTSQNGQNYKTLPPTIRKNGFTYVRVREGVRSYVYGQRVLEKVCGYEVLLKKVRPRREVFGKVFPKVRYSQTTRHMGPGHGRFIL